MKNLFGIPFLIKFEVQFQGIVQPEKRDVNTAVNFVSTSYTIAEVFLSRTFASLCNRKKPVSWETIKGASVLMWRTQPDCQYLGTPSWHSPCTYTSPVSASFMMRGHIAIATKFMYKHFSLHTIPVSSLHWCSDTLPVGRDAESAGSLLRADPDPV